MLTAEDLALTMRLRLRAKAWTLREWSRRADVGHTTLAYWTRGEHLDDVVRVLRALEELGIALRVVTEVPNRPREE